MTEPDEIRAARREVRRCQSALDSGSPASFWRKRLDTYAKTLEAAAVLLRMQLAAMALREREIEIKRGDSDDAE